MSLVVGVPTEIKDDEARIAITPDGVRELNSHGIDVLIQAGAGAGSSLDGDTFRRAGAEIVADAPELWERAELICKVKEPQPGEFAYLHLAAYPGVADALLEHGVTGIAYETVQLPSGDLPLLAPMSEVAGRMSVQVGAHFLERPHGGRGVLMGGAPARTGAGPLRRGSVASSNSVRPGARRG